MREEYESILAEIFLKHLRKERTRLGITQEAMSKLLFMSLRSYSDLEHGACTCGTLTFVLFLINCCENPYIIIQEITLAFDTLYAPA